MKKFNLFLIVGLICGMIAGVVVCNHASKAEAASDGIVNMDDFSSLASNWLATSNSYADLETNCRIDVGFYTGNYSSVGVSRRIEHGLNRVPDAILIVPLGNYKLTPGIMASDPTTGKAVLKYFSVSKALPMTATGLPDNWCYMNSEYFMAYNPTNSDMGISSGAVNYSMNRDGINYMWIAISQEIPAME